MAEVKTKPTGLPSGNTVDPTTLEEQIDDGGTAISFSFGSRTIRLDAVPEMDETFVIMLKVAVKGDGNKRNAKGELVPRRDLTILSGWQPGKKPLSEDPNQPGLYEIDPVDGAPAGDEDDGDPDPDAAATGNGANPAFSDGGEA